jgi:hypothetical protein
LELVISTPQYTALVPRKLCSCWRFDSSLTTNEAATYHPFATFTPTSMSLTCHRRGTHPCSAGKKLWVSDNNWWCRCFLLALYIRADFQMTGDSGTSLWPHSDGRVQVYHDHAPSTQLTDRLSSPRVRCNEYTLTTLLFYLLQDRVRASICIHTTSPPSKVIFTKRVCVLNWYRMRMHTSNFDTECVCIFH